MAKYEIIDLRKSLNVPEPVILEKSLVLASINPESFVPVLWLAGSTDYHRFRAANMGFDLPDIQHKLSGGGGKVYSFYGNPGQLQEINPNLLLETTHKNRVLYERLTQISFQSLYDQLLRIEQI